jgi:hypothetical protein
VDKYDRKQNLRRAKSIDCPKQKETYMEDAGQGTGVGKGKWREL